MTNDNLEQSIEDAWERRDSITPVTEGSVRDSIGTALNGLDSGRYRVAEPRGSGAQRPNPLQAHYYLHS